MNNQGYVDRKRDDLFEVRLKARPTDCCDWLVGVRKTERGAEAMLNRLMRDNGAFYAALAKAMKR